MPKSDTDTVKTRLILIWVKGWLKLHLSIALSGIYMVLTQYMGNTPPKIIEGSFTLLKQGTRLCFQRPLFVYSGTKNPLYIYNNTFSDKCQ